MTLNTAPAKLLPKSHTGRRFTAQFGHPYKFIEANNPYVSQETGKLKRGFAKKQETNWRTESKYPIRPRTLWRRFEDPTDLIGVSFGEYTNYVLIDVDAWGNPYHPVEDEGVFKNMLGVLEDIGLMRPLVLRSSFSEGVHVFYFFKEAVKTFDIACAMEGVLRQAGITPKSGQVELFPNTKSYGSHYKAHRLPLQPKTGSIILDENYEPLTDDVDSFLNMADRTAECQDMDLINAACKKYGKLFRLERCGRGKNSLKKFENDLLDEFSQGFTEAGQTNNLLLTIACYGVVFMGLDEEVGIEPLVDYIVETITNLDGYAEYCNHQHEIEKRAREVAKSSQSFYWAAGKNRKRQRVFKDAFGKVLDNAINGNQAKSIKALQRLQVLLDHLKESGEEIPTTMKAFKLLLIEKSKAIFDEGFSPVTLGKPNYKSKWLPVFTALVAAQLAVAQPQPAKAETIAPVVDSEIPHQTEQHTPLNSQLALETISLISGVLQEGINSAVKTPPKIAESRSIPRGYTPCKKGLVSKPPEPAETLEGTHLGLYEGFGKGEAPSFKKLPSPSSPIRPPQLISPANQSQPADRMQNPRPVLKSEHKQRLSDERELRSALYYQQMQELHAAIKALEEQRRTEEYQQAAKTSFAAIHRILGVAVAKFKRGTPPSPPT